MAYEAEMQKLIEKVCVDNNIELKIEEITRTDTGRWHPNYYIYLSNPRMTIRIKNMESGCGLVLLHDFIRSQFTADTGKIFEVVANFYKGNGAGSIIATLGDTYYDKQIDIWGFKQITQYDNFRHERSRGTQRLYIRSLKRE